MNQHTDKTALEAASERTGVALRHVVRAEDGAMLRVHEFGPFNTSTVVLVLPCGATHLVLQPWIVSAAARHRVIVLETRFILDANKTLTDADCCDARSQVSDVLQVARHLSLPRFAMAGYCTGALVALHAATQLGEQVTSVVLANGVYQLSEVCARTDYERDITQVLQVCARNKAASRMMLGVLKNNSRFAHDEEALREHTTLALRDFNTFYKYACVTAALFRDGLDAVSALHLRAPLLLIHGACDDMVDPAQSRRVLARWGHASLRLPESDDHYAWCRAGSESIRIAMDFLAEHAIN